MTELIEKASYIAHLFKLVRAYLGLDRSLFIMGYIFLVLVKRQGHFSKFVGTLWNCSICRHGVRYVTGR